MLLVEQCFDWVWFGYAIPRNKYIGDRKGKGCDFFWRARASHEIIWSVLNVNNRKVILHKIRTHPWLRVLTTELRHVIRLARTFLIGIGQIVINTQDNNNNIIKYEFKVKCPTRIEFGNPISNSLSGDLDTVENVHGKVHATKKVQSNKFRSF